MNILITGACGQLGRCLRDEMTAESRNLICTDVLEEPVVERLDITDPAAVRAMVHERGIDVIVNCAAYTNVDKAESEPELAELLNARAPGILAEAMAEVGGLLVHISTDYVFGGEVYNTPCTEDMKGTPTGVYGLTKLHGEQAIAASGCRSIIIRTAWLYSEYGRNFVKTMLALTAERPSLKVVFDQAGTPTYARDLAAAIVTILDQEISPRGTTCLGRDDNESHCRVFNFSNEGVCSWYDFAKAIALYAGHTACDVQPCHSNEFPSPVRRPAYSVLDKTKIKQTFGVRVPYWTESLKKCIKKITKQLNNCHHETYH